MPDSYKTIIRESQGLFKDRGSRFLGFAFPVCSESEAEAHIARLRKAYHDARHVCYAYRLGPEGERYRANDDGEPSNSAGQPILRQIKSADLTDVLVAVVRYFGGSLLGVSGLINAYKTATYEALRDAEIVERLVENRISLSFSYELLNEVMRIVKEEDIEIVQRDFTATCRLTVNVRKSQTDTVRKRFERLQGCDTEV